MQDFESPVHKDTEKRSTENRTEEPLRTKDQRFIQIQATKNLLKFANGKEQEERKQEPNYLTKELGALPSFSYRLGK